MFYFTPCFSFLPADIEPMQYALVFMENKQSEEEIKITTGQAGEIQHSEIEFDKEFMRKLLQQRHSKSRSKFWSQEDDDLLLKLAENNTRWEEIAKIFPGKNIEVCKRRHERLIRQNVKWPKENEAMIKHLCQVERLSWKEIQKFLPMYTKKQIKQRYKNFLEVESIRAEWTIQQDLRLWEMVKLHGNKWVRFTKIFQGRTQLQLKNRYNKLIKPISNNINSQKGRNANQDSDDQFSGI